MNNLFGIKASLSSLATDLNGFVNDIVEEFNTLPLESNNKNEDTENEDFEEAEIERELKHQLLELSDDENAASTIRSLEEEQTEFDENKSNNGEEIDAEAEQASIQSNNPSENEQNEIEKTKEINTETITVSIEEYNALHQKYICLKQNYRKSMDVVEKYQIHNKSLKASLNEQIKISEEQKEEINEYKNMNQQINEKLVVLQNEYSQKSIFESSDISSSNSPEMITKSVNLSKDSSNKQSAQIEDERVNKLEKTLQKASNNMKELKKRYKKIKQDLVQKIEEYDQLKNEYVTQKLSASKTEKALIKKLELRQNVNGNESGLSKEMQCILNGKLCLNENECSLDKMSLFQIEIISLINACNETMIWLTESMKNMQCNVEDNKSDSVVMIGHNESTSSTNNGSKDFNLSEIGQVHKNVVCLREVVCEFIATIQQNLKILNDGIERKQIEMNINDGTASKCQNID